MSVVYFIQSGAGGPVKIGFAADIRLRIAALQTGSPEPLMVLASIVGGKREESLFHNWLFASRHRGEWFKPTDDVFAAVEMARRGELPSPREPVSQSHYSHIQNLVEAVRAQVRCSGWSKKRLAQEAGLHANTLLGCDSEDWNPTAATMIALERVLCGPLKAAA